MTRPCCTGGGYNDFLDIDSAINWWLVETLCLNEEASRTKNMYIYKDSGEDKIYVAPPWDFDAWTFGITWNPGVMRTGLYYTASTTWLYQTLLKEPGFVARVKEKWAQYKPLWEEQIPDFIDTRYEEIHRAAERNEVLWADWHRTWFYPEKTYECLIQEIKEAFIRQLEWMDTEIDAL